MTVQLQSIYRFFSVSFYFLLKSLTLNEMVIHHHRPATHHRQQQQEQNLQKKSSILYLRFIFYHHRNSMQDILQMLFKYYISNVYYIQFSVVLFSYIYIYLLPRTQ